MCLLYSSCMNYEITYSTVFLREKIKEIYVLDNVFREKIKEGAMEGKTHLQIERNECDTSVLVKKILDL